MDISARPSALVIGLLSLCFAPLQAAQITWASGVFSSDSIQTTHNVAYAVNVGSSGSVTDSATGVVFGGDGGANLTESAPHGVSSNAVFLPSGTTGDAAFDSVLNSADFPSNFKDPIEYTLKNVTPGQTYTVELLLADTRPGFNGRIFTASQAGGGAPSIDQTYGFANGTPEVGGYALGTFTADSTTQDFQILNANAPPPTNDGNPDVGGQLNALILAKVPEPGSFSLLALLIPVAIVFRRKLRAVVQKDLWTV